ncbi:MAG: T9SS type A sorting domain-containing protein [Flavobacteriales bacterium]|nr:T9SS type A sorting domain-containing protein [Flavobacteriales bacterium]
MMRYIFNLILICLFTQTKSQVTLQASDFIGNGGDNIGYNRCLFTPAGNGGSGVSWDFSFINVISPYTLQTLAASNTPYPSSFPNASYASYDPIAVTYDFYRVDNLHKTLDGEVDPSGTVVTYTDPKEMLVFPFSFGDSIIDDFAGTYLWSGTNYVMYRTGRITTEADAYGAVDLPYGTVNDLLRVRYYEEYQDSNSLDGLITNYVRTTYKWFKKNNRTPVLEISNSTINGVTLDPYTLYMDQTGLVGMEQDLNVGDEFMFNLFPNPSSESTFLHRSGYSPITIELFDMHGALLQKTFSTENQTEIATGQLAKGVYSVRISDPMRSSTQRLIVQ